jgi:hypothetical protein
MKTHYKHIWFERYPKSTSEIGVWECRTNREGISLGRIAHGVWNRITFCPEYDTEFSADCLRDIADFIGRLEKEVKCG